MIIGRSHFEAMLEHLKEVYPLEGCGMLGGKDGRVYAHYPIENRLGSAVAFEMAPAGLVAAMVGMEAEGLELLAIYHSHPAGAAVPSSTDIALANYPNAVQIIVSFENFERPEARGYVIDGEQVLPIILTVV